MRRVFLLFVIIGMCMFVAVAGTLTFLNSDSVLKQNKHIEVMKQIEDISILVDITENKIYLISEKKIIKSYPIEICESTFPPPSGNWIVSSKNTFAKRNEGYIMFINVSWGTYGIQSSNYLWSINKSIPCGYIKLNDEDAAEIYKVVRYGTQVRIYRETDYSGLCFRVLKPGDKGSDVYEIQRKLKKLGYYKGYLNGIYNDSLKDAVHKFQRKNNMTVSNIISYSFYRNLNCFLYNI